MPTYDYKCNACNHRWELFQSMSVRPVKACPSCGKKKAERLIGMGAALLFKGGGFYETDYRSDSYKKAAEADKKSSEPAKAEAAAPTPTKSDAVKADGAKSNSAKPESANDAPKASPPKTESAKPAPAPAQSAKSSSAKRSGKSK